MRAGDAPAWVARALDNPATLAIARLCLVLPFAVSGVSKLVFWQAGVAETAGFGLEPAWVFNLATVVTQLGGAVLVVINRQLWLGAGALAVFTVLATVLGHRFWELGEPQRAMELNSFLEHATIAAAFILVTVVAIRDDRVPTP